MVMKYLKYFHIYNNVAKGNLKSAILLVWRRRLIICCQILSVQLKENGTVNEKLDLGIIFIYFFNCNIKVFHSNFYIIVMKIRFLLFENFLIRKEYFDYLGISLFRTFDFFVILFKCVRM